MGTQMGAGCENDNRVGRKLGMTVALCAALCRAQVRAGKRQGINVFEKNQSLISKCEYDKQKTYTQNIEEDMFIPIGKVSQVGWF